MHFGESPLRRREVARFGRISARTLSLQLPMNIFEAIQNKRLQSLCDRVNSQTSYNAIVTDEGVEISSGALVLTLVRVEGEEVLRAILSQDQKRRSVK